MTAIDDSLYEVVDGVSVEKDVSAFATWLALKLYRHLGLVLEDRKLGQLVMEMVFILDPQRNLRRRPDAAVVLNETWSPLQPPPPTGDWAIVPDIAIEIVSPGNTYVEMLTKVEEYFRYGVQEVWLAIPELRTVQVFTSPNQIHVVGPADLLTSPLIPDWSLQVSNWIPEQPAASAG